MIAQQQPVATSVLQFDEAAARRLEELYSHPDVIERRHRVRQALALQAGERVLDIGCGPGFQTTEMAEVVGPNGWAHGIDISASVLYAARHRSTGQPYSAWIDFTEADATDLPFADGTFDAAVVTQVYEYVPDVPRALSELNRVLRPGARAVIVDTDWDTLAWHAADPGRASRILGAWDEHLTHPSLPRTLRSTLRIAGFDVSRPDVLNILNLDWDGYSKGVAGLVAAFVPGRRGIALGDADAWIEDLRCQSDEGSYFFSLDQFLFLATKPAE